MCPCTRHTEYEAARLASALGRRPREGCAEQAGDAMEGGAQLVTGSAPSGTPGEPPESTAEDSADTSALVRLAREGDAVAFEHLVRRYQTPLRVYLARLTGDEEQARDLAQDVFWQAWRRLHGLRDPALFRAWL